MLDELHRVAIRVAFALYYGNQPYGRYANELERTQWLDVQELQARKLRALVEHTYRHVPFYRQRWDHAGIAPQAIQSVADLARVPILTKQDIQRNFDALIADDVTRAQLVENHTGGSTGHPLTFFQDRNFIAWDRADKLRCYRMAGYRLGMRWAFLWGSDYDAQTHKGWRGRFLDRLIYNLVWINTFDLTTATLERAARELCAWQPEMLVAYVSSATLLARVIKARGIAAIRPRTIQTSAETLTPADRALIEETFGCRAFDRYGCREVGNIAHECDAHQGLHILAENNLVELLDAADQPVAPGQLGRIVVTNLNNYAMPFIRYEIGDLGIASARRCACGRGLPLLEAIVGRTSDVITSPAGKLLHGEFFTHLFYKVPGVQQFRVIQETRTDLRVQIVPSAAFERERVLRFLEETIHQHADPAFEIHFELRDTLPPASSGKYRFTISHVPLELNNER